jgi:hypothetical protein
MTEQIDNLQRQLTARNKIVTRWFLLDGTEVFEQPTSGEFITKTIRTKFKYHNLRDSSDLNDLINNL